MGRHNVRIVASAFLAAVLVATSPLRAEAQEPSQEELAEARRVFGEGIQYVEARRWEDAVLAFRQVLEIRSAPPVHYNLGAALVELGAYTAAVPHLELVVNDASADPSLVARATTQLEEIALRGGQLSIEVRGALGSGVVFVDDVFLEPARLASTVPVSAGRHVVSIRDGARERSRTIVHVEARETLNVLLDASRTEPVADSGTALQSLDDRPPVFSPAAAARADQAGGQAGQDASLVARPEQDASARAETRRRRLALGLGIGGGAALVAAVVAGFVVAGGRESGFSDPYSGNFGPGRVEF